MSKKSICTEAPFTTRNPFVRPTKNEVTPPRVLVIHGDSEDQRQRSSSGSDWQKLSMSEKEADPGSANTACGLRKSDQ